MKKRVDNKMIVFILYALIILVLFTSSPVHAHPAKESSCTACHVLNDPDASISVFIDNVATTSIEVPNDGTASFEIDYFFSNVTNTANFEGVGVEVSRPSGWCVAAGTSIGIRSLLNLSDLSGISLPHSNLRHMNTGRIMTATFARQLDEGLSIGGHEAFALWFKVKVK